jgi:hypothetical protein
MRRLTGLAAVAASIVLMSSSVNAGTVQLDSVLASGGDFTFNYSGTLSPTEGVTSGSKLIIFDFAGYVAGSIKSTSSDIVASIENVSSGFPSLPGFTDNPSIPNLIFTYVGPDFQTEAAPPGTYPVTQFSGLSAVSTLGGVGEGDFAGTSINNTPFGTGSVIYTLGTIGVPAVTAAIPEVGTWGLMLIGFGGIGFAMRNRRAAQLRLMQS